MASTCPSRRAHDRGQATSGDVAAPRIADAISQLVHDQPILIGQRRRHALALDAGHLEAEGHDQGRVDRRREQRLHPRHELVTHLRSVNDGSAGAGRRPRGLWAAPARAYAGTYACAYGAASS